MDVAKYIGLFLLKNQSCYIHGLGNIELRRKPATYDGRNLISAKYEIAVVPTTSVDDSLSNFIATNEQISISKASNALKEFTEAAKADLQAGKEVPIPALGNFYEVNEKLQFATALYLTHSYDPIPAEKSIPRRHDERKPIPQPSYQEQPLQSFTTSVPAQQTPPAYNYSQQAAEEEERKGGIIWWRVILFVFILAALIGGIGFAVKNMLKPGATANNGTTQQQTPLVPAPDTIANMAPANDSAVIDTSASITVDPPATIQPQVQTDPKPVNVPMESYLVVLNTYDERARAEKRVRTLRAYGNKVELKAEDSNTYFVVMPITAPVARRSRVLDSLKNNFNPDGVIIY